ncbi:UPF0739 protein C1orf74 homolog [Heteronotia binoei]|uniref:UPF0739 protein C1orf74 homolog n=1 Tax=Heteronotia binoei TaxID=13085 RepID=UPI00292CF8D3|nr:UPF0739 protein C1orf74 homolog [Heteronotia binoei]XP_060103948.1 UPF0739 protein C1orf74 homolog [Heteronotia binoei]
MAKPFPQLLIDAAQRHLRAGKKGLSRSSSLQLAGKILAVAAGLKPAFLYDYNLAGRPQILNYVQSIGDLGCRLHILSIADHVLIINLDMTVQWLEMVLQDNKVVFVDVSAARTSPGFCDKADVDSIKAHISEILNHLKALAVDPSWVLSSSSVFSAEWNLCTLFGVLLGYPAAYSFPAPKSFDNCLSLTPLRVFTVQTTFCRISDDLRVQLYSFSVPENLYSRMKTGIEEWSETLQDASRLQKDFSDLGITSEIVTLEAVAL